MLSGERSPVLPNLPTAAEQGLKDFSASTWFGVFLPKGAPEPIVRRLNGAILAVMGMPAVQARMKEIGAVPVSPERRSPAYLRQFLGAEKNKWMTAINAANIAVE